jgi:hypothetical protein
VEQFGHVVHQVDVERAPERLNAAVKQFGYVVNQVDVDRRVLKKKVVLQKGRMQQWSSLDTL